MVAIVYENSISKKRRLYQFPLNLAHRYIQLQLFTQFNQSLTKLTIIKKRRKCNNHNRVFAFILLNLLFFD